MSKTKWIGIGILVAGISLATMWTLGAQQPGVPASQTRTVPMVRNVAVVDIDYIFKNHARHKQQMEAIRAEAATAEQWAQQEQASLKALAEQLKDHQPGTPTYSQIDDTLLRRQKEFEADVLKKRKDLMLREAKVVYSTYQEIVGEIQYFAAANGIMMVFRFNGTEPDPNNPEDVLRTINRWIVYQGAELDITPIILQRLNARVQTATAPAPSGGVAPGTGYVRPGSTGLR